MKWLECVASLPTNRISVLLLLLWDISLAEVFLLNINDNRINTIHVDAVVLLSPDATLMRNEVCINSLKEHELHILYIKDHTGHFIFKLTKLFSFIFLWWTCQPFVFVLFGNFHYIWKMCIIFRFKKDWFLENMAITKIDLAFKIYNFTGL